MEHIKGDLSNKALAWAFCRMARYSNKSFGEQLQALLGNSFQVPPILNNYKLHPELTAGIIRIIDNNGCVQSINQSIDLPYIFSLIISFSSILRKSTELWQRVPC